MCTYIGMSPTPYCSICSRSSKRRAQYKWSESTLFFFQHGAFIRVERPGPFKGHSREKTYCSVKIGCPLSGPCTAYWVTSCWLASKSSVGYLKGGQSLDPCQFGCSHTGKWLAVHYQQYSPRSLDTSDIPKMHSLRLFFFCSFMIICDAIGSDNKSVPVRRVKCLRAGEGLYTSLYMFIIQLHHGGNS